MREPREAAGDARGRRGSGTIARIPRATDSVARTG